MRVLWLQNEQQQCPKKVDLTLFLLFKRSSLQRKITHDLRFFSVEQQNFNPQLMKGCKSSLKIMPSLIILNVNYSEVQTETKNLFHTKTLDILIGPSEQRQNNFLSRKFTSSLSEPQPQPSRTSLTRLIIQPVSASSGVWPRWKEEYTIMTDISNRGTDSRREKNDRLCHHTLVISHFVRVLHCGGKNKYYQTLTVPSKEADILNQQLFLVSSHMKANVLLKLN